MLTREQEEEEREKEVKVELPEGAGVEIWGELTGGIERMRERYYVRGEMHREFSFSSFLVFFLGSDFCHGWMIVKM